MKNRAVFTKQEAHVWIMDQIGDKEINEEYEREVRKWIKDLTNPYLSKTEIERKKKMIKDIARIW